jgi:hypothetical protein
MAIPRMLGDPLRRQRMQLTMLMRRSLWTTQMLQSLLPRSLLPQSRAVPSVSGELSLHEDIRFYHPHHTAHHLNVIGTGYSNNVMDRWTIGETRSLSAPMSPRSRTTMVGFECLYFLWDVLLCLGPIHHRSSSPFDICAFPHISSRFLSHMHISSRTCSHMHIARMLLQPRHSITDKLNLSALTG